MRRHLPGAWISAIIPLLLLAGTAGCGLFEPRDPEDPSQSSLNYRPPTEPAIVIANLQSAVDQRNQANYISCFSDAARGAQPFVFIPSADAAAAYGGTLAFWSLDDERSYFQNLIARSSQQAYASLTLTLKTTTVTSDSVISAYDYVMVFEHNEAAFPRTARGSLQFTFREDASNFWAIQRWVDFKTTNDVSWSDFKGKFSN